MDKLKPVYKFAFLYAADDFTVRELAEVYGISKSRISQIVREIGWRT